MLSVQATSLLHSPSHISAGTRRVIAQPGLTAMVRYRRSRGHAPKPDLGMQGLWRRTAGRSGLLVKCRRQGAHPQEPTGSRGRSGRRHHHDLQPRAEVGQTLKRLSVGTKHGCANCRALMPVRGAGCAQQRNVVTHLHHRGLQQLSCRHRADRSAAQRVVIGDQQRGWAWSRATNPVRSSRVRGSRATAACRG